MAVCAQSWIVLPHDPIEILAPNVWRVEGRLGKNNRRIMLLARLKDGRIIVHNAIALDDASMAKIDAWGEVAAILIPNAFHRQDSFIMQTRYPMAKVYAPSGAIKAASKATPCAGAYRDAPADDSVKIRDIEGIGGKEGLMLIQSDDGTTAVFCDTLLNIPPMGGLMGLALSPTGTLGIPRAIRWMMMKDKQALKNDLLGIAATDGLVRLIPGHGATVTKDVAARTKEAAERLG